MVLLKLAFEISTWKVTLFCWQACLSFSSFDWVIIYLYSVSFIMIYNNLPKFIILLLRFTSWFGVVFDSQRCIGYRYVIYFFQYYSSMIILRYILSSWCCRQDDLTRREAWCDLNLWPCFSQVLISKIVWIVKFYLWLYNNILLVSSVLWFLN